MKKYKTFLLLSAIFIMWKENPSPAACVFYVYLPIEDFVKLQHSEVENFLLTKFWQISRRRKQMKQKDFFGKKPGFSSKLESGKFTGER